MDRASSRASARAARARDDARATMETSADDASKHQTVADASRGFRVAARASPLVVVALACVGSFLFDRATPWRWADADAGAFSEGRARATARTLESGGARPCGSAAEALAFDYVERELAGAVGVLRDVNSTVVEMVRRRHGWGVGSGWTTAYGATRSAGARVRSARAVGEGWDEVAVVLSAHVDTVHASVGGSDNGGNVASALEVTRALMERVRRSGGDAMCDERERRCAAVIVMFSTAEEDGLVGAHGLVRTHEWFADSKVPTQVILNLESMGAGGPHRLFQARTDNAVGRRALRAWARVAPRGSGSVFAEDIFNSGIINSGTDYAVFREFGVSRAMFDFAFIERTSVYHTPRDRVKFIRPGSLRHSGDNLLAFMAHFVARGGFASDSDDDASARPISWYTIPGYGIVAHDAPSRDAHAVFIAGPLLLFAVFLHRAYVGDVFAPRSTSAHDTVIRMENTFRVMATIPLVVVGCALAWVSAVAAAAAAPVFIAHLFGEPNVYIARPVGLIALSGSSAFFAFIVLQRMTTKVALAFIPLSLKMKPSDEAWRIAEWSVLFGEITAWGALASRMTRAELGSSYVPLLWLIFPTATVFAPVALSWLSSRARENEVPAPPPGTRIALTLIAPLWITFPNALVLLRVLQGVGARTPVSDDTLYLYDGIAGAVVGVFVAMTTSLLAPSVVTPNADSKRWRRSAFIAMAAFACACAYTLSFMLRAPGGQWTALTPQPLVLTHVVRASSKSSHVVISRAGASSLRRVETALRAHPRVGGAFAMTCSPNATFDLVNVVSRGACVLSREHDDLFDEAMQTGASAPTFGEIRVIGRMRRVDMSVGDSRRWVLAVDKRCVARVALVPASAVGEEESVPKESDWSLIESYRRGSGARATLNGVAGGVSAAYEFVLWYEPREETERDEAFMKNATRAKQTCSNGVLLRADYIHRTPSIATVDSALPKWTAPFGKHKSPQWLAFVDALDVSEDERTS